MSKHKLVNGQEDVKEARNKMNGDLSLTQVNDELDDLETSNPLLPPDLDATSALEVVPVHNNVHSQVKNNGNPRDGSQANQLSVAKKSSGTVVVAVEESQGLLLEEQEDGVEQLKILGQIVELENHSWLAIPLRFAFGRNSLT